MVLSQTISLGSPCPRGSMGVVEDKRQWLFSEGLVLALKSTSDSVSGQG
jgi:hypothetical protein